MTTVTANNPALDALNVLDEPETEALLLRCCGSPRWAQLTARMRPFHTEAALLEAASDVWRALTRPEWLQAFAAHPKIGGRAPESSWSALEQRGAASATDEVLDELEALNAEYASRFGYIFIICATGLSAEEMLSALRTRIEHAPDEELVVAAREQERITELRLRKLLTELGAN